MPVSLRSTVRRPDVAAKNAAMVSAGYQLGSVTCVGPAQHLRDVLRYGVMAEMQPVRYLYIGEASCYKPQDKQFTFCVRHGADDLSHA
jgi:hypothetical protein